MTIINEYFEHFAHRDIERLSELYAEDVILKDWIDSFEGKENVLNANKELFKNASSISVQVKDICSSGWTFACQIRINLTIAGFDQFFDVVDVIKINEHNKIQSIEAYVMNPSGT